MPVRFATTDANFDGAFAGFLASKREVSPDVEQSVRAIIADVRQRGDAALVEYTRRFDQFDLSSLGVRMAEAEIREGARGCDAATLAALAMAKARIEAYHVRQLPKDERIYRQPRCRAWLALVGDRVGRSLRPRRASPVTRARC